MTYTILSEFSIRVTVLLEYLSGVFSISTFGYTIQWLLIQFFFPLVKVLYDN